MTDTTNICFLRIEELMVPFVKKNHVVAETGLTVPDETDALEKVSIKQQKTLEVSYKSNS